MEALFILLVLIIALILWIALIPLQVTVDTDAGLYQIGQPGIVRIVFHPWQQPLMHIWFFGFRVNMTKTKKKIRSNAVPPKKKTTMKRSLSSWHYLFKGVYSSFQLQKLVCTVDLDDPVRNARFIPVLLLLNRGVVSLSTNFVNRNFLYLKIRVSVGRILWTTFRFYTKN